MKKWTNEQLLMLHIQNGFNLALFNRTLNMIGKKDFYKFYKLHWQNYCRLRKLTDQELKELIYTFRPV